MKRGSGSGWAPAGHPWTTSVRHAVVAPSKRRVALVTVATGIFVLTGSCMTAVTGIWPAGNEFIAGLTALGLLQVLVGLAAHRGSTRWAFALSVTAVALLAAVALFHVVGASFAQGAFPPRPGVSTPARGHARHRADVLRTQTLVAFPTIASREIIGRVRGKRDQVRASKMERRDDGNRLGDRWSG